MYTYWANFNSKNIWGVHYNYNDLIRIKSLGFREELRCPLTSGMSTG